MAIAAQRGLIYYVVQPGIRLPDYLLVLVAHGL